MFLGTSSTKKISLGGRRKNADRKAVIEEARRKKNARAHERLRIRSATRVQSVLRGRFHVHNERTKSRQEFDAKLGALAKAESMFAKAGRPFHPPVQAQNQLLRLGLFVTGGSMDGKVPRLLALCKMVVKGMKQAQPAVNLCSQAIAPASRQIWLVRMSRLCVRVLSCFHAGAVSAEQQALIQQFREFVQIILEPQKWKIDGGEGIQNELRLAVCRRLLGLASLEGMFQRVVKHCEVAALSATPLAPHPMLPVFLDIGFSGAGNPSSGTAGSKQAAASEAVSLKLFSRIVLRIPFVAQRTDLRSKFAAIVANTSRWVRLLHILAEDGVRNTQDAYLFGNVIQLMQEFSTALGETVPRESISAYATALVAAMEVMPAALFTDIPDSNPRPLKIARTDAVVSGAGSGAGAGSADQGHVGSDAVVLDMSDDDGVDLFAALASRHRRDREGVKEFVVSAQLQRQWSLLLGAGHVRLCLDSVLPKDMTGVQDSATAGHVLVVLQLFQTIMSNWSSAGTSLSELHPSSPTGKILLCIALAPRRFDFIPRMWSVIRNHPDLASFTSDATAAVERLPSLATAMSLFFASTSQLLKAVDDNELFVKHYPLEVRDLSALVLFLKQMLYRLCWRDRSALTMKLSSRPAKVLQLLANGRDLFNQLYGRDCRRTFADPKLWLWPELPLSELLSEKITTSMLEEGEAEGQRHARTLLVLTTLPQVIPFTTRAALFQEMLDRDKAPRNHDMSGLRVKVRRDHIYEDSISTINPAADHNPRALRDRMRIQFIDASGAPEAGIDGGGLFKEFIDHVTKRAFDPEYGLWLTTASRHLHPNPNSQVIAGLDNFQFMGRLLGKALYEGVLVEPEFAGFFMNKLLDRQNYVDDLQSLDSELHMHLLSLKEYTGDLEDLDLYFDTIEEVYGEARQVELMPGGSERPVTNDNVNEYVLRMAHYLLNVRCHRQSTAFLSGFNELIPAVWMRMFSQSELQLLIGGTHRPVDVSDLKANTKYVQFEAHYDAIRWFWEVLEELSADDMKKFLSFTTSCSRPPLLGFSKLYPPFCVQHMPGTDRLPKSATCYNTLKMPNYPSKEVLREKLLLAIRSTSGFHIT